jgi:hypothetical protein
MLERWAHPKPLKPPLSNGFSSINPGVIYTHLRAIEADPGATETHSGAMRAHPKAMKNRSEAMEAHPRVLEAGPGALEAHPGERRFSMELCLLTMEWWMLPSSRKLWMPNVELFVLILKLRRLNYGHSLE